MSFYQKVVVAIVAMIVVLTVGGVIIFVDDPFVLPTLLRVSAVLLGEVLCGVTICGQVKQKDSMLPFTLSGCVIDITYLLIAIVMAFIPASVISTKVFIYINCAALILLHGVFRLVIGAASRNIEEQELNDQKIIAGKQSVFQQMNMVLEKAKRNFAENKEIVKKCQRLTDDFRFGGNCIAENSGEFTAMIAQLQSAVESADAEAAAEMIETLLIKISECQSKTVL